MLSIYQSIILGALQGITELFPISSLGHSVILPSLLGWHLDQGADYFLVFLVATHLATSLVLFGFFFQDWVLIIKGLFRSLRDRRIDSNDPYAKLGWLLVVTTIPAGILGLLFQDSLQKLFALPRYVAIFLVLNGIMLYGAEILRRRTLEDRGLLEEKMAKLSWWQGIKIGIAQSLALLPGFSRTGATLAGGLMVDLDHEAAARFSFLLATPIIFAAAVLKIPDLVLSPSSIYPTVAGTIAAAIAAYFSVRFLTKYFKTKTLTPFAVYCIAAGIIASIILLSR